MAAIALLGKDVREHRLAAVVLSCGSLAVVLLLLAQNASAPFSMSPFEIVRFALLSFLPLIALIVGNRLVVREYLSGTHQFVEALPVGSFLPLILKYLVGYGYLAFIATMMVLLAARQAGVADDVTPDYLGLILAKTLVMCALYWSVVFCFSLCGHLRIALYLLAAALVALIAWYPGIDAERVAPFALMDDQLFVFERDRVPWEDMAGTALLALVFALAGFVLSRLGEGSVVERLARPMTRRDYVALGVLAASGMAIWSTLLDRDDRQAVEFSSDYVVRLGDPAVAVLYLEEDNESSAQDIARRTHASLSALQATLGLAKVPDVKLALTPGRERHDFDYETADGVFVSANWLEHDGYDDAILDSVVMHGVLSAQTGGRAMFEPYHWVLDGFTRWWVEQGRARIDPEHQAELVARALWVLDIDPAASRLVERWQLTADRFSYPGAESLAWASMAFLEQSQGRETVLRLANEFLVKPVATNALATLEDRRTGIASRFEWILGMPLDSFHQQWQQWLTDQREEASVRRYLARIPSLQGRVISRTTTDGVHTLSAGYELRDSALNLSVDVASWEGLCVMKHDYIGPFDTEFEVDDEYQDEAPCQPGEEVHVLNSFYSPGDRVLVALDYEGPDFHQPLRLYSTRLSVQ
ncbi:MAG: ABC transporter permease [Granulosicoccus sp.]|nr:ABC transporter permease [Granulosicoccus sp.]